MENETIDSDEKEELEAARMIQEPLLGRSSATANANANGGGFRTIPFILANEAFEKVASSGLAPNMIIYLMSRYHMTITTASNFIFVCSAATYFFPVLAAFIADSFLGRFTIIALGSLLTLLGMILLWLTTIIPQSTPSSSPTIPHLMLLYLAFALTSVGSAAIRSSSLAFGTDQLQNHHRLKTPRALSSYFSCYYVSSAASVILGITLIVYIQDHMGWTIGFGIPILLMFVSTLSFFSASRLYVKRKPKPSLIAGLFQVVAASYKKRHIKMSTDYYCSDGTPTAAVFPSERFGFLNRACVIEDRQIDLSPEGEALDPWSLCTVDQVEELKSLIKVFPLWSTGIAMCVTLNQGSFRVIQAGTMDRHVTPTFEIPSGSFGVFMVISAIVWIALYDRILIPLASRIAGKPAHLTTKERMGIGLSFSCIAIAATAMVERFRRANPAVRVSAMWLIPQNCLAGLAEAFNLIGQNEFYISEFPEGMGSIASTLTGVGFAVGNLVSSLILSSVDMATKGDGKQSWVSSDINKGHYDYYCWLLSVLSFVNIIYFAICSRSYGPCKGQQGVLTR